MKCKAYNSSGCLKHCETYKEALKVGWQCCIYCYYGKNKNGCLECDLEYRKDYNMKNLKIFSMVTGEEGEIKELNTQFIEITGFNESFIELGEISEILISFEEAIYGTKDFFIKLKRYDDNKYEFMDIGAKEMLLLEMIRNNK